MNSDTKNRWKNLAKKLCDIYKDENRENQFKVDLHYLSKAYFFTEKLWYKQFNLLPNQVPKVVMLSEAPLFGDDRSYFYNPDTAPTAFFWSKDAIAVVGEGFADCKKLEEKQFLINSVTDKGFLILDLFPYSLNKNHTNINYHDARKSLYLRIFQDSLEDHLRKKLDLIEKCSIPPLFLFRYKRLKNRLHDAVAKELRSRNLLGEDAKIESVGGSNMSLDRQRLADAIKARVGRNN